MVDRRVFLGLGVGVVAVAFFQARSGLAGRYEVQALTAAEMEGALVVDIRQPEEWAATGVIEGAKLLTYDGAERFLAQLDLQPGQRLVLVCQSGRRSGNAAAELSGLIDNPVISQDGGMSAWVAAGNPVVGP